ncbi:MAG TPA: efflux RND transporter periplasmic adaptor subunit [Candidatus Paceibacterota bacterium]|nr:efflux RND transporter periplasmic adaptor subunit [Candidatus Paceibacterota bacterium]
MTRKRIIWSAVAAVLAIGIIWIIIARNSRNPYQLITVTRGSITESVTVTGNTTPETSLDLAFQNGGTVAVVNKNVGDHVNQGDVIARLNTSDLQAQLAQARASVDAQQATLANLQAGAQAADIEASQAALAGGEQTLANDYGNVNNVLAAAYANANDAVRTQLQAFFTNAEQSTPALTFNVNTSQTMINAQNGRVAASAALNAWQSELATINAVTPSSTLDDAITSALNHLSVIKSFLSSVSTALVQEAGLSTSTLGAYNTAITAATNEANTASTNVTKAMQDIASQKIAVQQLQAQLNLKLAGSTPQQIAAQQAQIEQAQANEQGIQVKIDQASLVAPVSGTVTVQNAKVGQIATPGAVMTSLISDNGLEVDAFVPETDIGKISVGDPVSMTFDAFQGQTFPGKIFYVDPAQTIISGVVDYKVKISFTDKNPNMKSGLTANVTIDTKTDENALIVPQYAVLQNDQGNFVEVLQNGNAVQIPVTLGVSDQSGSIEIASGVTEGEQLINIGLKQ